MNVSGSLIANSSSMRVHLTSRFGRVLNYLNTNTVSGAWRQLSGIAIDPGDGSVWSVCDTTGAPFVTNFTKGGSILSTFPGSTISASITELEGVTVSPKDYTLWFVEDSPLAGITGRLWHCQRNGTPIGSPIDLTPHGIASVQDIEYDPSNDTLLVICNVTSKVYRMDLSGALVSTTDLSGITPQPGSWQGIAIDLPSGNWWLSGYTGGGANVLICVDPSTLAIILSIDTSGWTSMGSIAGIAFDPRFDKQ